MKKMYVTPSLKVVNLNMQVLLCGSDVPSESPMNGMNNLPSEPGVSGAETSSNLWVSNTSSIWDR